MPHSTLPDSIPEGFIQATHGGNFAKELGPFYSKRENGRVSLGIRVQPRHCNSAHNAHGGFVASLADLGLIHAVGVAQQDAGHKRTYLTTANLTLDFIGPAPKGAWLEVVCDVSRIGRKLGFVEGIILADGQRVGRTSAIIAVLGPRD